jgi:hypothetical protein
MEKSVPFCLYNDRVDKKKLLMARYIPLPGIFRTLNGHVASLTNTNTNMTTADQETLIIFPTINLKVHLKCSLRRLKQEASACEKFFC